MIGRGFGSFSFGMSEFIIIIVGLVIYVYGKYVLGSVVVLVFFGNKDLFKRIIGNGRFIRYCFVFRMLLIVGFDKGGVFSIMFL